MEENKNTEDKKFCTSCKQFKPLSSFNKDKRSADGHYYICRECAQERMKKYLENSKNKKLQAKIAEAKEEIQKKDALTSIPSRELMEELMRRGYEGNLSKKVELTLLNGVIVNNDKYKSL